MWAFETALLRPLLLAYPETVSSDSLRARLKPRTLKGYSTQCRYIGKVLEYQLVNTYEAMLRGGVYAWSLLGQALGRELFCQVNLDRLHVSPRLNLPQLDRQK
ncbi:hypothetical protein CTAM01_09677 [Colletotrichum tamarilloi]|uniref:Uncharacterized protein n=1 Tax=Colletotrichum tamarilloi TaxID=1209934 RepID=A0ABQ9R2W8_9PEZI|nr:uncharacterized protein CTAM01_09677 [Colletotrichum tamarilloi]KAK1492726.1 hypothetical protein CTAM01_09677 [Colletotrichum tamarilloi]